MLPIRPLRPDDCQQLIAVYHEAVISQAGNLYSPSQIEAWSQQAGRNDDFRSSLLRGHGLVSTAHHDDTIIEAFALLDPADRLALLYCRGRSSRQGRASALLEALEQHARSRGVARLRTEASQLSRPLLERRGWVVDDEETVTLGGVAFLRWRMGKDLL
ncbi:GNAT family N-acetyltransferase [Synechococcus sp. CCAP 1479/9]|uniref:GNAT family N-acetyltransferase n=1 Tax=Synechococcus sp. CCAP 1479/9 TaxID=1221593 RepID=UPI001C22D0BE|nr:GNAT family N-acetyltransferase [Synechococcus sp. CCAP 1479/9]